MEPSSALLMVESLSVLMNTAGWAMAFPAGERPVSAARLLGACLAGDAVNYPYAVGDGRW